jgi:Tfp pilus assembly protein PilN
MQPLIVTELDFLPAAYRQQSMRHRDRRWRAVLFIGGVMVLAAAWTYRVVDRRAAQHHFDSLTAAHDSAVQTQREWEAAQQKLLRSNQQADLITYLKHPWATSQTLAAIIRPMPESVRLTELKITREPIGGRAAPPPAKPNPNEKPNAAASQVPPAVQDLTRLREEYDQQQVVVLLSGETLDGDALHRYIRRLESGDVFAAAELKSLQRREGAANSKLLSTSQFEARAVMRPGIGQAGGTETAAPKTQLAHLPSNPAPTLATTDLPQVKP